MDWQSFWNALGGLAWDVLQPVLVVLLTAVAVQLARKLGIEVSEARQAQLEREIANTIRRAEELRANGTLPRETDILSWVTLEMTAARPKLDIGKVEDLVHALLPKIGLGAAIKSTRGALAP